MTAKTHGMEEECQNILELSGLTEDQITLPATGKASATPKAIVPTFRQNWPTKVSSTTVFEEVLMGQDGSQEQAAATNGFMDAEAESSHADAQQNGFEEPEEEEDAQGWDMGEDAPVEAESDFVHVEGPEAGAGSSEADLWARTSPVAADHVAGGSFDTAMQLLSRQVGAVNFEPLQERFEEIYLASRTFLPANPGMPPLVNYVRRTVTETDPRRILPIIPRNLETVTSVDVAAGKNLMRTNKLEDGVVVFRRILHTLLVNAVSTPQEAAEVCSHCLLSVVRMTNTRTGANRHPLSRTIHARHVD